MKLNELTEEQIAKLKSCRDSGELMSELSMMGIELTDEQLNAVAGSAEWFECSTNRCNWLAPFDRSGSAASSADSEMPGICKRRDWRERK